MELLSGDLTLRAFLSFFALLAIYKIFGKYIEEFWFWLFPFKNQRKKMEALQAALIRKDAQLEDARQLVAEYRALAEAQIVRANEAEWELIKMRRTNLE